MKLLRYGPAGSERPGMLDDDGVIRDLSAVIEDVNGKTLAPENLAKLRGLNTAELPERRGIQHGGPDRACRFYESYVLHHGSQ
jgi:2,4-diketo-3-deoxy-L-fuconate hydrolase